MRVLHLITTAGPHPYFEHFGTHTDRGRFDVRLATLGPPGALHRDAARMRLPSVGFDAHRRAGYARALGALVRYLRREQIDVIQTHLLDACVVGLLAARIAGTRVRIFTAHHSHEIPLHHGWSLSEVDRLASSRLANVVISPSEHMKATLVMMHGLPADRVRVIHHGFDLAKLDPGKVDASAIRRELGLDGKIVLTSIGRLYWIKNQEALVQAFASLNAPETVLLLAGAGDSAALDALIRSLGLESRVFLLGNRGDVPELLAGTDLYVHPAQAESFAMVIVEAMAMGVPVLSTPVGIASDVIEQGVSGFLAGGSTSTALSAALRNALEQREDWKSIGSIARERADLFPAERMVREHESLYLELLPRP